MEEEKDPTVQDIASNVNMDARQFQADPSFKKEVEKKAKAEGISLSEFIRRAVAKELGRDDRYLTASEIE